MNFPFYIAKRYLFTKKSHHAINVISGVSVCGVALATLALVCTLSVFNGFQDLVTTMFTAFDPEIKITAANGKFELVDNGRGDLMGVAGLLKTGVEGSADIAGINVIKYHGGGVDFALNAALTGDITAVELVAKEDVTGTPCLQNDADHGNINNKRFLAKMEQISLSTVPDMLVAEYNIAALGAMKKATGSDMATFLFTKLRELYTKMINYKLVATLENGYPDAPEYTMADLDLTTASMAGTFHDYRSRVDLFDAYLINVESELAKKAVKGVTTTAYLAGANAANQFQKGGVIGKWEKNTKMTYINDLLGWYNGIPVLRSTDVVERTYEDESGKMVTEGTFYAIHKTADGQMAPLARGIYMPLTDTPTIGNYNNPTQMAAGIYYQEGTRYLAPELVQKVTFKMGF